MWGIVAALAAAAVAAGLWWATLPRLREPATDGEPKRPYAAVRSPSTTAGVASAAALLSASSLLADPWAQPIWLLAAAVATVPVALDALTTWIPASLTYLAWAAALTGIVIGLLGHPQRWPDALVVLGGAASAGLIFLLLWRVSGSFGYGDVRFAPLIGGLGATIGTIGWGIALSVGCLLVIGHTLITRLRGHAHDTVLPWTPALFVGTYATLVVSAVF